MTIRDVLTLACLFLALVLFSVRVEAQQAQTQVNYVEDRSNEAAHITQAGEDARYSDKKAQEAAKERQARQSEYEARSAKADGIYRITHDATLAGLLSDAAITEADLQRILEKYDWKQNLAAEQVRASRVAAQFAKDLETAWISVSSNKADFAMSDVKQNPEKIIAYVKNNSGKDFERFTIMIEAVDGDGKKQTFKSDYVDAFAQNELRRASFPCALKGKQAKSISIVECRAYRKVKD